MCCSCSVASYLPPSQKQTTPARQLVCKAWGSPDVCHGAALKLDVLLQTVLMTLLFFLLLKILKSYDLICSPMTWQSYFSIFHLCVTY